MTATLVENANPNSSDLFSTFTAVCLHSFYYTLICEIHKHTKRNVAAQIKNEVIFFTSPKLHVFFTSFTLFL